MTINVQWYSRVSKVAEVWRILDLSGLTHNPRQSKQYMLAGFVYLNGNNLTTLKDKVEIGSTFTLELRFPGGKVRSKDIYLSARLINNGRQRTTAVSYNYRG